MNSISKLRQLSRENLQTFKDIKALSEQEKNQILRRVRRAYINDTSIKKTFSARKKFNKLLLIVFIFIFILLVDNLFSQFVLPISVFALSDNVSMSVRKHFLLVLCEFLLFFFFIAKTHDYLQENLREIYNPVYLTFFFLVFSVTTLFLTVIIPMPSYVILAIFLEASLIFALLLAFSLYEIISIVSYNTLIFKHLEDVMIVNTFFLIHYIENLSDTSWGKIENKNEILLVLESNSIFLEGFFPLKITSHDAETVKWKFDYFKMVAKAHRELKKWVIAPKIDTKEILLKKLSSFIFSYSKGDWDNLEKKKLIPVEVSYKEKVLSLIKTAFVAFFPLGTFSLLSTILISQSTPLTEYMYIGSSIWAIIVITATVDPTLSKKITVLKSITSIIPK